MFQYVIQGWYILTIVLIAAIVGYLAYYLLQWFSLRRAKKLSFQSNQENNEEGDEEVINIDTIPQSNDDSSDVDTLESILFVEKEDPSKDDHKDVISMDDSVKQEWHIDGEFIEIGDIVAEVSEDNEMLALKKHRVKNIAEGVSRDDILQDKHEKNLQKVKYEAVLCKQRNDLAGYEKKLIEGLILDPDDVDIFRQLADFYFGEGKYTKALSMFRKILLFDPEDHHALWQIGEIYIEQGQYEDAQIFIEKALSLSPDNPKYYISLIDISIAKNELQQALSYLEKIVNLRPRNISYLMALGEMYEKLNRKEDAKMTYFKVLEIDPLHIDVKHILKKF